ncbi:hypothetical protein D779_3242 [Imhoffiella purpurea]|uniref:Uncharacterized protein n=2 Tax=Imhoffiella purpurea TaxID=1249627 RepID=W9V3J4_9GAMM|nr:hypothetical protein D779_3242 [Imhoffiella purpurea]
MLSKMASLYGVTETALLGHQIKDEDGADYRAVAERLLGDPEMPAGLHELAADQALMATLAITSAEWEALGSIKLPHATDKIGYLQLLATIRGISRA